MSKRHCAVEKQKFREPGLSNLHQLHQILKTRDAFLGSKTLADRAGCCFKIFVRKLFSKSSQATMTE